MDLASAESSIGHSAISGSSSCPASDEVSSDNLCQIKKGVKRKASSNGGIKCLGTNHTLPESVCKWKRHTVGEHFNIHYDSYYLGCPLAVLRKAGDLDKLTEEQNTYVSLVNSYLHFDAKIKKYDPPYAYYSKDLKPLLDAILKEVMTIPEKEEAYYTFARIKIHRFLKELGRLMEVIEEKKKKYEVSYEVNYSRLIGAFAELCCLEAVVCTSVDQTVWKDLSWLQVTSKPDFRFFKCGILESTSDVVVSVVKVKRDFDKPLGQVKRRREFTEPLKKRRRISSASSSPSTSTSSPYRSIKNRQDKPQIEHDLDTRILGQHAGELLLDLDRYRVPNEKLANLSNKLTMPGMIVDGTKVYFTLLEMTVKHHTRLHYNQDLEGEDQAIVYYSQPLDILIYNDRKILIENFIRLNNIP